MLLERDPHQLVEGITIASYAVQCNVAFVYVRGEFALGYERLTRAIDDARGQGLSRPQHPRFRIRLRHRRAPRRRRVHLWRGDGAARVARRRARHAAHPAAVPRDRRSVREADRREQRRDVVDRAAHHADGRRGIRQARREPVDGHAHLLGVGSRQPAGQLRGRARHDLPRSDLRPRRRHPREPQDQVLHPRWRVVAVAHRERRASRRAARHGLRAADVRRDARFGRGHGVRRDRRPAAGRVATRQVLRARVVRQVHAVPRRHGLDREGALPHVARRGPARGPRPAHLGRRQHLARRRRTRRSCRPRSARSARRL